MSIKRSDAENASKRLVFGNFYGKQLLNIRNAYFEHKKLSKKASYISFLLGIFNSMRSQRKQCFDFSFSLFLSDLNKAKTLMKKFVNEEMKKGDEEQKEVFKESTGKAA